MDLPSVLKVDSGSVSLSTAERAAASLLIVERDANDRNMMRSVLKALGYGAFTDVPNHMIALEKFQERKITHVIFDARKINIPTKEFLGKILEMDRSVIALPSSRDPNIDEVFDLLIMGARGYLVKPFTADTIELGIAMATKGEPLASAVVNAKDRNEALVAIMMASLDKAATTLRQAQQFETAKRDIPRAFSGLKRSAELAKTFAKGGDEGLLSALEKFCLERSQGPATKLGRLRKKLSTVRTVAEDEIASAGS
jgi:DNA-binding NarL/FixJ family response regulator